MACLQLFRELLSLATFLRDHSNQKTSYLFRQNVYPNVKTISHIKLQFCHNVQHGFKKSHWLNELFFP